MKNFKLFYTQVVGLLIANLKIRYRKTIAGFIWVLLNPTILLLVQTTVFSTVLKIPIKTYLPYLFSGFLPWVFISQTIDMGTTQHKYFSSSIKAFNIHPAIVTLALTFENLINLLSISLIYFIFSSLFIKFDFLIFLGWIISYIPLTLAVFSLTFAIALLFSKFKDIKFITSFVLSLLFFVSPIFYSLDLIPIDQRIYFKLNPFYHLILPFQSLTMNIAIIDWMIIVSTSFVISIIFFLISLYIWRINKKDIYLYL